MGGRREVSITFYRPVIRSDLKRERSFFRGSVSTFLQLVVVRTSITVSPLTIIAFRIRCVFVLRSFVCGMKIEFLLQLVDGMNIKSDGIIVSRPLSSGNFL